MIFHVAYVKAYAVERLRIDRKLFWNGKYIFVCCVFGLWRRSRPSRLYFL